LNLKKISNAPKYCSITQIFSIFKTIKDESIELYDLEKPIKAIKDAHLKDIHSSRHFLDIKTNSDLLIII
jgi:hypothetical protein